MPTIRTFVDPTWPIERPLRTTAYRLPAGAGSQDRRTEVAVTSLIRNSFSPGVGVGVFVGDAVGDAVLVGVGDALVREGVGEAVGDAVVLDGEGGGGTVVFVGDGDGGGGVVPPPAIRNWLLATFQFLSR